MKVVIAGNRNDYRDWLEQTGLSSNEAIYVNSNEQLMGMELAPDDVVYVGAHWLNPVNRQFLASRIRLPPPPPGEEKIG